jgi:hypothetical protein
MVSSGQGVNGGAYVKPAYIDPELPRKSFGQCSKSLKNLNAKLDSCWPSAWPQHALAYANLDRGEAEI